MSVNLGVGLWVCTSASLDLGLFHRVDLFATKALWSWA